MDSDLRLDSIRVLHVDDDPSFVDLTATYLERKNDALEIVTATGAEEALDCLEERRIDCIVSDYDMPGQDGLELLQTVRNEYPDLPFILFTGKGSEEVAGRAISAGASDYLQKDSGTEQYGVLANRITNLVEKYHAEIAYRDLFESITAAIIVHDPKTHEIVDVNDAACDLWGYTREDFRSLSVQELSADEGEYTESRAHTLLEQTIEEGDRTFNWKCEDSNGEFFWAEITLKHVEIGDRPRVLAVAHDISELKERESELQTERDRFATLWEHLNVPVAETILEQTTPVVQGTNPAFEEVFGVDSDAVAGTSLDDHIVPQAEQENAQRLNERVRNGEAIQTEVRRESTDGYRQFQLDIIPFGDTSSTGQAGAFAIYSDITNRKRLERKNRRLEKFADIISHDLRNPLNTARGRAELAHESCDTDDLEFVIDALERMDELIDDLRTLSQTGYTVNDTEQVDLSSLVDECWNNVAPESASIVIPDDVSVKADAKRLKQVFENLFRNAVEHGGSDITARVGSLENTDGFYVADDGPGIPENKREEVFEAGYTTSDDGTGLGLNIVKEIVEAHGWNIRVDESKDGGARFVIETS